MAQDIRKLFETEENVSNQKMSQGHEARFLEKLDREIPKVEQSSKSWSWMQIAASLVVLIGLSIGAFKFFNQNPIDVPVEVVETPTKSLGDVVPDLKKVEDYYVANINFELSKIKPTPETKELFDGFLERLEELNKEYQLVSQEVIKSGPDELTIDALINNLKLRLDLLYRLKEKLKEFNTINQTPEII